MLGAISTAVLVLYYALSPVFDALCDVKGPALARYTRLWEVYKNWQGRLEHVTVALHDQYGNLQPPQMNRYIMSC